KSWMLSKRRSVGASCRTPCDNCPNTIGLRYPWRPGFAAWKRCGWTMCYGRIATSTICRVGDARSCRPSFGRGRPMHDGSDTSLKRPRDTRVEDADACLRLLPIIANWLDKATEEIAPRTSGGVLQVGSRKRPKWAPMNISEPESFVLRHDWEIMLARRIHQALAGLELNFLEAQVLYRHFWKAVPLRPLADYLDVTEAELAAAKESLLHKAAGALEELRQDLARLRRRVAAGG